MSNVIIATFGDGETTTVTKAQYRWARGQILKVEGVELPSIYRVNFSNSPTERAKTQIGTADGVIIPDVYFTSGKTIYAYIMLNEGDTDVEIEYLAEIPVNEASEPEEDIPTEEQVTIINQAISALATATDKLNEASERIDSAVTKMETLTFRINELGELIEQTGGED